MLIENPFLCIQYDCHASFICCEDFIRKPAFLLHCIILEEMLYIHNCSTHLRTQ